VRIRAGGSNDVEFLIAIGRDSSSVQWSERQYRDLFECASESASRLVLVAEYEREEANSKGAPAGSNACAGFLIARRVAHEWELENIVVSPAARRSGLGARLLEGLLQVARERNGEALFLEVRDSNAAARGLYEKLGFRQTGRRKSYYANPLEDAILYRLDLSKSFSW
jgi:[ribosomal protein S18]-alanine N-acetyltransferase